MTFVPSIPSYDSENPAPGFERASPQATLIRLLNQARPEDVLQALAWALSAGPLDWTAPATPEGLNVPQAWLKTCADREKPLPDGWFDAMDRWSNGQVWTAVDAHGETLLHHALRAYRRLGAIDDQVDQTLAELVRRTDPGVLRRWTAVSLDLPDEQSGTEAPSTLVDHLLERSAWHTLHATFEHGLTLLGDNPDTKIPRAAAIDHVTLWDAYMQQGGDPEQPVAIDRGKRVVPLWQALRAHTINTGHRTSQAHRLRTLRQAVEQWALQNRPTVLDEVEKQEYWDALNETGADGSTMKSRVDWPDLRDEHGRTPMMVLVQHKSRFLKEFRSIKKAESAFAAQDQDGRTLWYYLLRNNTNDLSTNDIDWLIEHVPLRPDHQGLGLVQQCLMTGRASRQAGNLYSASWPDAWLPDTERWWGTPTAQDRMADWMMARTFEPLSRMSSGLDGSFATLASIALRVPCWSVTPRLLGALVINELAHVGDVGGASKPLMAQVTPWLDAGAQVNVLPGVVERLNTLFDQNGRTSLLPVLHAVLGRLEANALATTVAQAPTALEISSGARRRL